MIRCGFGGLLVLGINRLQIFFVLVFGYFLLKDKPARHTWIASSFMIIGTLMIKLG